MPLNWSTEAFGSDGTTYVVCQDDSEWAASCVNGACFHQCRFTTKEAAIEWCENREWFAVARKERAKHDAINPHPDRPLGPRFT